jgi:flagellum-specific ATP synthase
MPIGLENVARELSEHPPLQWHGHVETIHSGYVTVTGLSAVARVGETVKMQFSNGSHTHGEIVAIESDRAIITPEGSLNGLKRGDRAVHLGMVQIAPCETWIGRIIDPNGSPLDGRSLLNGSVTVRRDAPPPNASERRSLGPRLETGMALFDTILPIVRGQRLGLFAGSGVGKTTLLGRFATGIRADLIIIALVGERGRELNEFVNRVLGPMAMKRTIVVAATSDQSAVMRRRCALTAMATAEHFRDQGRHVLLILDSLTRFAEAHREIAVAGGESVPARGFPASTAPQLTALCERAGPGTDCQGDITAIFSVLVAGSDMEEPIADLVRGILDGHIILDRDIAERGRFPAVNVAKSVSRSLPEAAGEIENETINLARRNLTLFEQTEIMLRAGLYSPGNDPKTDAAIKSMPELELFFGAPSLEGITGAFARLKTILETGATAV